MIYHNCCATNVGQLAKQWTSDLDVTGSRPSAPQDINVMCCWLMAQISSIYFCCHLSTYFVCRI